MNFLVITNEFQLENLTPELKALYNAYQKVLEKRTEFQNLAKFQSITPNLYDAKCKELASTIKYITYRADRKCFDVRPCINGKRIWLGSERNFDDACWLLSEYLKLKINDKTI